MAHRSCLGRSGTLVTGMAGRLLLEVPGLLRRRRIDLLPALLRRPELDRRHPRGQVPLDALRADRTARRRDARHDLGGLLEVVGTDADDPAGLRQHGGPALAIRHDDRQPAALGGRDEHDVARSQRAEPFLHGRDPRFALAAPGVVADPPGLLEQRPVLEEVAEVAPHLLAVAVDERSLVLELAFLDHDAAVGQELRERRVQQVVGLLPRVVPDEVHRHVVGGPERRRELVGPRRRERRDPFERDVRPRLVRDDCVPHRVDPAPSGAAGELCVLPRREHLVAFALELHDVVDHHALGRHVDPERQRLRGEHDLDEPLLEQVLHGLLEQRQHPRVVGGDARPRAPPGTRRTRASRGPRRPSTPRASRRTPGSGRSRRGW